MIDFIRRSPSDERPPSNVHNPKKNSEVSFSWGYDRIGFGTLLPSNSTCAEHVQEQAMYKYDNTVNIGDKIDYGQQKNVNLSDLIQ